MLDEGDSGAGLGNWPAGAETTGEATGWAPDPDPLPRPSIQLSVKNKPRTSTPRTAANTSVYALRSARSAVPTLRSGGRRGPTVRASALPSGTA